jgi:hypothetical protein
MRTIERHAQLLLCKRLPHALCYFLSLQLREYFDYICGNCEVKQYACDERSETTDQTQNADNKYGVFLTAMRAPHHLFLRYRSAKSCSYLRTNRSGCN